MNKNTSLNNLQKLLNNTEKNISILYTTFKNIKQLKKGGFGTVYSGIHLLDQNKYAIKKIPIKQDNDNIILNKFTLKLREVRCLSSLNHKNIIRYHTSWIEQYNNNTNIFIQMELMDMSLDDYFFYDKIKDKLKYQKQIIENICNGVKYLHDNNIVHCDLKPDNILLNINDNDIINIKIGDFGLVFEKNKQHYIDEDYGTSLYMPSEHIYTNKYDIYSLGIIFFEIYNNFTTLHEKYNEINNLKNNEYIKEYHLLYKMININYNERCDINYVISYNDNDKNN
tara:strand:- start:1655 stop:2500 length:846 start_codon:yes stop_codon:yes gene_type:complete